MEQIDRDVMRTHPDMHFFSGDTEEAEQHRREMKRCLFMFAKLNPGLRYIQGMNELLAPLYYMFRTDPDKTSARYAEADSFYCFVDLISEFRDHFCQQLDNSSSGIKATIGKLVGLLHAHDPELAEHMEKCKVWLRAKSGLRFRVSIRACVDKELCMEINTGLEAPLLV